jgi:hypothetical protein
MIFLLLDYSGRPLYISKGIVLGSMGYSRKDIVNNGS